MDELIGAIIPLLAVAGWLFGLFNKDEKNQKKHQQQRPSPKPTPTPSGGARGGFESPIEFETTETMESNTDSYYDKKREQINKLKDKIENNTIVEGNEISQGGSIHDAILNESTPKAYKHDAGSKKTPSISVTRNLTKRGLAESVIMAEVLGPPKALKPYHNVVQSRRNR